MNQRPSLRKKQLRRAITARILALDPDLRRAQETILIQRFSELPGLAQAVTVLFFVNAFPEEFPTSRLWDQAFARNQRVLCPRVDASSRQLRLHRVHNPATELQPGSLGIPEPCPGCPEVEASQVDWVLVPGLAFDQRGYRLGRGAGYYDRLLPRLRPQAVCWALSLDCQLVENLPVESHDVPLDGIALPERIVPGARGSSFRQFPATLAWGG